MNKIALRPKILLSLAAGIALLLPAIVNAGDNITGRIIGYNCVSKGEVCPVDRLDPHITLESDFVLVDTDGEYFFLTNLPRDTKVRYVLDTVTVNGDVNNRYNAITVAELTVNKNGKNQKVWSDKSALSEVQQWWKTQ